eukprot:CAMPEP_0167751702 /NCGR_PEP_ID=MMETSP0110_2-20121227/6729_1 /TAXON_ID=629695 /ORGANISM="Gymnochlora sp., Strain CCMP2014" /LENGTH=469 /DNA_ID=CAMNT_0007637235 /DNA_START=172 /DNA_END=1581 /DNA_ORIENTATION=+
MSAYFGIRCFILSVISFIWLSQMRVQGNAESFYRDGTGNACMRCYKRAGENPGIKYDFSYCNVNGTEFPKEDNLLNIAQPSAVLSPESSDIQYLNDMNAAQITIWGLLFGFWLLISYLESQNISVPSIIGITSVHRSRYLVLRNTQQPIDMENMCSFGLTEGLIRNASFHMRTVLSVLTIPVMLAVLNEHYRWVTDEAGCYTDVAYQNQATIANLYYIMWLSFFLLLYITVLLAFLLIVSYCCRKHLYQLIRLCFVIFFMVLFVVNFVAVFFLLANAIMVVSQAADKCQIGFALAATLTMLEVEWILLAPCSHKVLKSKENLHLRRHYQGKQTLTSTEASECRMVAFLMGLSVPEHKRNKGASVAEAKGRKPREAKHDIEMRPKYGEGKYRTALEKLPFDPLFDRSIFRIINEMQTSEAPSRVSLEDYLQYRLWKVDDEEEKREIKRIHRKMKKHGWYLDNEHKHPPSA